MSAIANPNAKPDAGRMENLVHCQLRRRNACRRRFLLVRRGQLSAFERPRPIPAGHTPARCMRPACGGRRKPRSQPASACRANDAAPILSDYTENATFEVDPFVSIDRDGVGELMRIGTERGRKARSGVL
jgi:anti-sigma factor RsiW